MSRRTDKDAVDAVLSADGRGIVCTLYAGAVTKKSVFTCSAGHAWEATADNVLRGRGCPYCSGKAKVDAEEVNRRLVGRGIVCIGYGGTTDSHSVFRCAEGHEWRTSASHVMSGQRCPVCSGRAPVSFEEVNRRVAERGIVCLSYDGKTGSKSTFRCAEGHEWVTTANDVMGGRGCAICSGKSALTIEIVNSRLLQRGIACVEYSGYTLKEKSKFRCSCGNEWMSIASNVLKGSGCPACSLVNRPRTTHDEVNALLMPHGIECVSYAGTIMEQGSIFKCKKRHIWSTNAGSIINNGTGCPVCANYGFNPLTLAHLYYFKIQSRTLDLYKIGITNNHPHERARRFKADASVILIDSLCVPEGRFIVPVERRILTIHQQHISPEARNLMSNGYSETFTHDVLGIESGNTLFRVFQNYWNERDVLAFMRQQA